jgi:hypothetical protein
MGGSGVGEFGDGGQQFAGVVVFWLVEHPLGVAHFQELAGAHDGDARGDLRHHGQAVGDEYIGQREFALQFVRALLR